MQVELHLLLKGKVTEDIVEYEFGAFSEDEKGGSKKLLDELEGKIIQIEQQYNQFQEKVSQPSAEAADKVRAALDSIAGMVKTVFEKKK